MTLTKQEQRDEAWEAYLSKIAPEWEALQKKIEEIDNQAEEKV